MSNHDHKASKASLEAMHEADQHAQKTNTAIPGSGTHANSEAAHLGTDAKAHTKPVGDIRQIELKEESNRKISRAGEVHRGE